jgi:hypothetical protein
VGVSVGTSVDVGVAVGVFVGVIGTGVEVATGTLAIPGTNHTALELFGSPPLTSTRRIKRGFVKQSTFFVIQLKSSGK